MKIITRLKDQFSHSITHKKEKAVIAVTLICFAISGIALPQIKAQDETNIAKTSVEGVPKQNDKKTDISNSGKTEKREKEETTESQEEKLKETEEEANVATASSDDKNEHEKKEEDKKTSDNTSTAASSSPANNNSGSSPATPAPQPEKVWVPPVYKTVHHDAVYNTVTVVVCNYCGAEFGSAGEFQAHKDANGG